MIVPLPPLAADDEDIVDGSPPLQIVSPVLLIVPALNAEYEAMVTSSVVAVHSPLEMVHLNTVEAP